MIEYRQNRAYEQPPEIEQCEEHQYEEQEYEEEYEGDRRSLQPNGEN